MRSEELDGLTISRASHAIRSGELSPVELTEAVLGRIKGLNQELNAYITVSEDRALEAARAAEEEISKGMYRGPLHGIPIALKDIFAVRGERMTAGSKILSDYVASFDATVVSRLREAGAIILGKLNMHEFAFGVTGENPHYGTSKNPWNTEYIPGGSSSGSGTATATSMCLASLGTDTGGSVRIPAALCGVVGLKPTYGRISRYGVLPLSWSQDHVGIISKSVSDAAIVLQAVGGHDTLDPASSRKALPDLWRSLDGDVKGIRVGVVRELMAEPMADEVRLAFTCSLELMDKLGIKTREVSIRGLNYARGVNFLIIACEAAAYHERYLKDRWDDYGDDVRRKLDVGRHLLATHYIKAQRLRSILKGEALRALSEVDALVTPTTPIGAVKIGQVEVELGGKVYDVSALLPRFTGPFNLTGLPAISLPCGCTKGGLPLGLQLVGRPFDEQLVLRLANRLEAAMKEHGVLGLPSKRI